MSGRNFDEDVDRIERAIAAGHTAMTERDALRAEVERLRDADVVPGALAQRFKDERNIARLRVEQLEQALREYAEHQSWRCQYADKQYYLVHSPPMDDCACGFDKTMRDLGLHPDRRETT